MNRVTYTMSQALIRFLDQQYVLRDNIEHKFFEGCFGIFGHGNVAGIGEALYGFNDFKFYPFRNEQSMVHSAVAYARTKNRMSTFACTSSIGPGATNMVTGAALATINRLPVLLLPGDIFARRNVSPVLQQLESGSTRDISVNDCLGPVSKYWDRINRPEQLISSLQEAMRVLTSASDTGAVTLSLPQDTQVEAYDYPDEMFAKRIWAIDRPRPDREALHRAVQLIQSSNRPVIIAGGGVKYSDSTDILSGLSEMTGIPVCETFAGKGSLMFDHLCNLGAVGVTGTRGANEMCASSDLIIGIGTRYSDFTSASDTLFQNPDVRFININIAAFDAHKKAAFPLIGDAKVVLEEIEKALEGYQVLEFYREEVKSHHNSHQRTVDQVYGSKYTSNNQAAIIGCVNSAAGPDDIMVCASGSMPGELHQLWRSKSPLQFHLEYGYSCMGYEIAGGLGAKMASPDSEVYVLVGDGSYLMLSPEITTSIQEDQKLIIVLVNNHGYASIGGLSRDSGMDGYGTRHIKRDGSVPAFSDEKIAGKKTEYLNIDYAKNAESLGAIVIKASDVKELKLALDRAVKNDKTTVIYIEADRYLTTKGSTWWEVPIAQISDHPKVQSARKVYEEEIKKQRPYINPNL